MPAPTPVKRLTFSVYVMEEDVKEAITFLEEDVWGSSVPMWKPTGPLVQVDDGVPEEHAAAGEHFADL